MRLRLRLLRRGGYRFGLFAPDRRAARPDPAPAGRVGEHHGLCAAVCPHRCRRRQPADHPFGHDGASFAKCGLFQAGELRPKHGRRAEHRARPAVYVRPAAQGDGGRGRSDRDAAFQCHLLRLPDRGAVSACAGCAAERPLPRGARRDARRGAGAVCRGRALGGADGSVRRGQYFSQFPHGGTRRSGTCGRRHRHESREAAQRRQPRHLSGYAAHGRLQLRLRRPYAHEPRHPHGAPVGTLRLGADDHALRAALTADLSGLPEHLDRCERKQRPRARLRRALSARAMPCRAAAVPQLQHVVLYAGGGLRQGNAAARLRARAAVLYPADVPARRPVRHDGADQRAAGR